MTPNELMRLIVLHAEDRVAHGQWSIDTLSVAMELPTRKTSANEVAVDLDNARVRVDLIRKGWQGKPPAQVDTLLVPELVKPETIGNTLDALYRSLGT